MQNNTPLSGAGLTWRALAAIVTLAVLMLLIGSCSGGFTKPSAGEIGVVRNGGPLDNNNIRQIIPNGSGNTWSGLFSSSHYYPVNTQQRFFRMQTCGEDPCKGADALAITIPTSDGVDVTIEGTFYLNTVFDNTKAGQAALRAFDTQFSTRTFDGEHPYDGISGWEKFLAANVEPIVVNNLRETISNVACADLVSSCALVQNQGDQAVVQQKARGGVNQSNVAKVQASVENGLASDLIATLGGPTHRSYFDNIKFSLQRVILPGKVQTAIDDAQSSFAEVSQSQAKVASARLDARANELRQAGYQSCPTCARIDAIRALPRALTALGGNFAFSVGGR